MLMRGLARFIPPGSSVLASERGTSDALGETRKMTAVLTTDALLIATAVRTRTVLTTIQRTDIGSVERSSDTRFIVTYEDYERAAHRSVTIDLSRHRDRAGIADRLIEGLAGG
jgi:hypothetical protein